MALIMRVELARPGMQFLSNEHYVFAIAAFTLTYLAISEMTSTLRTVNATAWLDSPLRWTAWAVAPELALVVLTMLRPLRRVFGLFSDCSW